MLQLDNGVFPFVPSKCLNEQMFCRNVHLISQVAEKTVVGGATIDWLFLGRNDWDPCSISLVLLVSPTTCDS